MNIKNVLIVGSLATMLAATGCAGQAARHDNAARGLTNSVNSTFDRAYDNTYGYGYNNYDNYTSNGNYINDYPYRNYSSNTNNTHRYGRNQNNYNGLADYSYDNTWDNTAYTLS